MKISGMVLALIMTLSTYFITAYPIDAGTIYRYIDKDGFVIFTDNPPSGVKASPVESFRVMTEEEKVALESESAADMEQQRVADRKRREREEKIRAAREELEQAIAQEERFRSNMNQASGFAQRQRWRKELQEQQNEIEEKRKKIEEIERSP